MSDSNKMGDLFYNDLLEATSDNGIHYEVKNAIGLTYSLDLEALLSASLSFAGLGELDEATRRVPLYLLEGIRRSTDKFVLFCNRGQIKVPQKNHRICSCFDKCVCEVSLREQPLSNFHPKLWLVKETSRDNPNDSRIKVVILSRNLTFDNSIDVAVSMAGKITTSGERVSRKQKPLIGMLESLKRFTRGNRYQTQKVTEMIDDLKRVHTFELDDDQFEDYDFVPMCWEVGGDRMFTNPEVDLSAGLRGREMLIFSPFIDKTTIAWMTERVADGGVCALFTRKESLTREIYSDVTSKGGEIYVVREGMVGNEIANVDIHAKMYFVTAPEGESGDYLYVGSANATRPVFASLLEDRDAGRKSAKRNRHVNFEFLLRLKYKRSRRRLESFKDQFVGGKEPMFEPVGGEPCFAEDGEKPGNDAEIVERVLKFAIAREAFKAEVVEVPNQKGLYDVTLTRRDDVETEGCELFIAPIQSPANRKRFDANTVFDRMPSVCISEFYVLTVQLRGEKLETVIKVPTNGMPEGRDSAIFTNYIDTPEKFMQYVSLILTESPSEALHKLIVEESQDGSRKVRRAAHRFQPKLYEQMLVRAVKDASGFNEVEDAIRKVNGENVPKGFMQMFNTFKGIAGKLRHQ